jgi:DNA helicase II / ATP-dependent DNA helicase PcrA
VESANVTFYADLHVHSKYSRATSKNCDLENLAYWAQKKGIAVVGTGDFTHPAWRREIADRLVPAEPGLLRLRDDLQRAVNERLSPACRGLTRFLLSVEISTIYKKGDRTRKVHHLLYAPDLAAVDAMVARLSRIGNLVSDGRPILGLDSRDLLEIVLESGPHSYLVPAHVWTPWFAVLGSKSGFDRVAECYGDLAEHIFAIETGLSSDPEMNWRLSQLDRYTLVSNSDAHSPAKLGREACRFDCELDYFAMRRALETRQGFGGTVEFFPEEGKYHLDGHRKCNVVLEPEETRQRRGQCPVCKKPLTVGVMHRVQELADRPAGFRPEGASPYRCLIPLPEVIAEITGTGPGTKTVSRNYEDLLARLGDEFFILERAPLEDLARKGSPQIAEAMARMRAGKVIRQAGFDGEYGVIRVFEDGELERDRPRSVALTLPGLTGSAGAPEPDIGPKNQPENEPENALDVGTENEPENAPKNAPKNVLDVGTENQLISGSASQTGTEPENQAAGYLAGLDPDQRIAAAITEGALLIIAGPGTGKTRTLIHRIAHLMAERCVAPESCLAITFSNRAAEEMRERLAALLPVAGARVAVMTFHALALSILREHGQGCGLHRGFRVATDHQRAALLAGAMDCSERKARRLLAKISTAKRTRAAVEPDSELDQAMRAYGAVLDIESLIDFDDLLLLASDLLAGDAELRESYRARYQWISIDEYQDIDELQYRLIELICPPGGNLCAIGDPDQAIYGFRGADVGFFMRFQDDHPGARIVQLTRNYRSSAAIVQAALQAIAPSSLIEERRLIASVLPRQGGHQGASRIELIETATERAEAEFVVHTIEQLVGGTSFFSMDSGRVGGPAHADASFSDFAVLYRTEAQSESLCEALSRSGIPFQKRSHNRLADQPGVAALVESMARRSRNQDDQPVALRLRGAVAELESGLEADLQASADDREGARLVSSAAQMLVPLAERCGDDMARFLSELACGVEIDTWDPRADRVSLLTLHAAKGLEFRVVFLAGCEDGVIPLRWGKRDDAAVDEERRLFFVGVTRAQDLLYLTRARKRMWRGKPRETEICPFIHDIESALLNAQRVQARKKSAIAGHRQLGLF